MQKTLKFVALAQLLVKAVENRLLAPANGRLIGPYCLGHFHLCAFLPKQLFDQPPLLGGQLADSAAQILIWTMRFPDLRRR